MAKSLTITELRETYDELRVMENRLGELARREHIAERPDFFKHLREAQSGVSGVLIHIQRLVGWCVVEEGRK